MNAQKYTQKSLEAVQNAQSIATEYGNQQIEQPHLLLALLLDEGGLIPQLLGNMGLTVPSFTAAAKAEADTSAPVSGFRKTAGKSPKTEKAESPLRNQIGISRADAEQQPHSPGIAEEFDVRKAVLYSEIMAPKFKEE